MLVEELMALLAELPADAEVRLAVQPNYPHEHNVAGLRHVTSSPDDPDAHGIEEAPPSGVVYLLEGRWVDYANRDLWNEV
jgi:hypothetical protein